jgi:serine/threonine protein kinase
MEQMDLFRSIVKGSYDIPKSLSPVAGSIVKDFLMKNPAKRLGSLAQREDDVYNHAFFSEIDFDELRTKSITPPHKPQIKDPLDTSNFDDWSHLQDKTLAKYPALQAADEKIFEKF